MNIWGTFDDHRILRTLITFWGLWGRLEYLLWTYEDFEGFDGLLRKLRTFWGSVENLRSEYLGYLLCIFLTFWGLCGPFEDFLKTWGPDALRTLKNISGTFDDFLWTYWGPEAFEDFKDFSGHWGSLRTWLPTEELRTLITFWGLWGRLEYLLWTYEDFEGFDDLWRNLRPFFEDILRISWEPEAWGPWLPLCIFLTFWGLCGPFEDFLKTWGPEDLKTLKNFSGPFDDFLWTFWGLYLANFWGRFEDHLMTIWGTFDDIQDFEDVDNFLRTLRSSWIPFVDLWGLRGLWGPLEEIEDILRISWELEAWVPWVPFMNFLDILLTLWTFWGLFEDLWTWCSQNMEEHFRNIWWHLLDLFENLRYLADFQGLF